MGNYSENVLEIIIDNINKELKSLLELKYMYEKMLQDKEKEERETTGDVQEISRTSQR